MKTILSKNIIILLVTGLLLSLTACFDDLNQFPPYDREKDELLSEEGCKAILAKIYTGLGASGLQGPVGFDDLVAPDGDQGTLVFLRGLFFMQELPTDEAIWNWKDPGIVELINTNWSYSTKYAYTFYQRCMLNIRYCKEFLNIYTPDLNIPNVGRMRDEARGLRALTYFYLIDIYGNPAFVWDAGKDGDDGNQEWIPSPLDKQNPKEGRKKLFNAIIEELKDLEKSEFLPEQPVMSTYGKITRPVIWTLLAKMYLNAGVYTGTPMYKECVEYCKKIIDSGYFGLETDYANLFCGDNHKTMLNGKKEFIFAIPFDNVYMKSYGSTVVMTSGAFGGVLNPLWFGMNSSWTCLKAKESLIDKFAGSYTNTGKFKNNVKSDKRYLFFDVKDYKKDDGKYTLETGANPVSDEWPFDKTTGKICYIVDERRDKEAKMEDWDAGFLSYKFTNLNWGGEKPDNATDFPNTDFPLFRFADVYLMYIECAIRGAEGANRTTALAYFNLLRARAGLPNVPAALMNTVLTEANILDERARELYWEAQRRTDLIRFGKFTKDYAWPYKGNTPEGEPNIDDKFNLYPFSDKDLVSNPNLVQNEGYQSLK